MKFHPCRCEHGEYVFRGQFIQPLPGYRTSSGKPDKFIDAYMGKIYTGRGALEILPRGIEYVFYDAATMRVKDPEYYDFIVGLLAAA